jgi:hypothetical protein
MSIDLTTLFGDLGIVSGNTNATNQYEFYNGVVWDDDTITYNQFEFFSKTPAGNRYEFFKPYGGEFNFYRDISDPNITDYRTFYQYAGFFLSPPEPTDWILKFGYWEDGYFWIDTENWEDTIIG